MSRFRPSALERILADPEDVAARLAAIREIERDYPADARWMLAMTRPLDAVPPTCLEAREWAAGLRETLARYAEYFWEDVLGTDGGGRLTFRLGAIAGVETGLPIDWRQLRLIADLAPLAETLELAGTAFGRGHADGIAGMRNLRRLRVREFRQLQPHDAESVRLALAALPRLERVEVAAGRGAWAAWDGFPERPSAARTASVASSWVVAGGRLLEHAATEPGHRIGERIIIRDSVGTGVRSLEAENVIEIAADAFADSPELRSLRVSFTRPPDPDVLAALLASAPHLVALDVAEPRLDVCDLSRALRGAAGVRSLTIVERLADEVRPWRELEIPPAVVELSASILRTDAAPLHAWTAGRGRIHYAEMADGLLHAEDLDAVGSRWDGLFLARETRTRTDPADERRRVREWLARVGRAQTLTDAAEVRVPPMLEYRPGTGRPAEWADAAGFWHFAEAGFDAPAVPDADPFASLEVWAAVLPADTDFEHPERWLGARTHPLAGGELDFDLARRKYKEGDRFGWATLHRRSVVAERLDRVRIDRDRVVWLRAAWGRRRLLPCEAVARAVFDTLTE